MISALRLTLAATALSLVAPFMAIAQGTAASDVARARAGGLVGERFDGYLGLPLAASPMLRHEVQAINIRRRSLYADLSARRGVTLQEVGMTAACQLLGTTGVGERYLLSDNVWRVRRPGEPAPVPEYCR